MPDGLATLHVLGARDIAEGGLACSVDGARRAMVAVDLDFLRRVLAEAPGREADGDADGDLDGMSREALLVVAREMRAAIRTHRDASGHELCWHHPDLWKLLPDAPKGGQVVPDWPHFMRGCVRYRASLDRELAAAPRRRGSSGNDGGHAEPGRGAVAAMLAVVLGGDGGAWAGAVQRGVGRRTGSGCSTSGRGR